MEEDELTPVRQYTKRQVALALKRVRDLANQAMERYEKGDEVFPLVDKAFAELNDLHHSMDEGLAPSGPI